MLRRSIYDLSRGRFARVAGGYHKKAYRSRYNFRLISCPILLSSNQVFSGRALKIKRNHVGVNCGEKNKKGPKFNESKKVSCSPLPITLPRRDTGCARADEATIEVLLAI